MNKNREKLEKLKDESNEIRGEIDKLLVEELITLEAYNKIWIEINNLTMKEIEINKEDTKR